MIENSDFLDTIVAPTKSKALIMVLGVGGAGGNAVNHMYDIGIRGVSFMICNTDKQALQSSPIENKVQLGEGLGAGNNPARGKAAAIESLDDIMIQLENNGTQMVFITAGMGGGTGTGAAPVIAKATRSKGILTVGIVTLPFFTEGQVRMRQAQAGLEELRQNTDALVVIHNDNLTKIYGSLPFRDALHKADDVLATAAKGISEMITRTDFVNVDFADVSTVMHSSGMALMGSARAEGEKKIEKAVEEALSSPLLNRQDIKGAKNILFNISYGSSDSLTMEEATNTLKLIQSKASRTVGGNEANIIWGAGPADGLADGEVELTIIATGFDSIDRSEQSLSGEVASNDAPQRPVLHNGGIVNNPTAPTIPTEEQTAQPTTKWRIEERYTNIDSLTKQPAIFRRGVLLTGFNKDAKVQVNTTKVERTRKQDEEQTPQATEGTLF